MLTGTVFDVYGAATKVPGAEDYGSTISLTTAAGHKVVRSAGLYLDQLCDTGEHDRFATMLLAALRFQTDGAVDNWNAAHGKHQGTYWGAFEGWSYGPLHNRFVAHPFLLAAFHSKFIGEQ